MKDGPKIGAFVLDTLTTGMYTCPLDAVREFVQNAADSIQSARKKAVIGAEEGHVILALDPHKRTVAIRDNGTGIERSEVKEKLLNIGMSDKSITDDSGFRGIGRLAGIAYCKTLFFRTRASKDDPITVLELDCEGLRRAISPGSRQQTELSTIISEHSLFEEQKAGPKEESHFFEVILSDVTAGGADFLDIAKLEEYLQQIAPVGFDAQRFMFAPKIKQWLKDHSLDLFTIRAFIRTQSEEREVFKPYKGYYYRKGVKKDSVNKETRDAGKIEVKDIEFFPTNASSSSPFWLWYAKTELLGMIDDPAAGLRLRKRNIGIGGPERVDEFFGDVAHSDTRFNQWFIGEIHILDNAVIPNARRDGFEELEPWLTERKNLIKFARARIQDVRRASEIRNRPTQKVVHAATQVIRKAYKEIARGFGSKAHRDELITKVHKAQENLVEAQQATRPESEVQQLDPLLSQLQDIEKEIAKTDHFALKRIKSDLDRKQRKVIQEILEILHQNLDEKEYGKIQDAIMKHFEIRPDS